MSLVAVRVRELAEGGEDGGRVLLPNLLIMFFNLLLPSEIHYSGFQKLTMPARIVTSAFPLCDVRLRGIDATGMWSLASRYRSRGG